MECAECGHLNGGTARFCAECGTALATRCPSCASEQAPTAKFCDQCGASLVASPGGGRDGGGAVRKNVTAVFVDLVGSTAFGERLDPEAVRDAIAPYHELVRAAIEDHDGTLAKFMGDGAMAVFGLPEVAEDDAIRAVSAGVDLQRRFRAFVEQIRVRYGVELGLRVGINSGELVVDDTDADLVGDVLNTAARLESACEPGAVLVGEDTWRLTRSVIEYEVLGEVRVKGKAEPIATFRVVDHHRAIADEIPFVGRETELGQLALAFDEVRDTAVARLVTVIGAPGVGKTRLAAELRGAVDARSFDLRFERRGSTTFTPIAQLLRDVTDGTVDGVARLFDGHPNGERLVPLVQSFLGHVEARSTEESFWAVRRLLEHLASTEPLIVVVDDIQWAEPLFWDLLDHLVEWARAPVLIVALARPELRDLRPELTQAGRRVSTAIALEGLDDSATRELTARLLDTDQLPGELFDRIPDSTEGNPLFVRELVQMLIDDGTLARDGERWYLTIDADAIDVPPTVMSMLAARVERLPDDERQLVELASVIGTDFDRGTLTAIAEPNISSRLGVVIDALRRKDLVEPSGAWAGDHPVYRFHHVLIRDAAYRRLLKGHRAELHEGVGRHFDTGDGATGTAADELDVVVAHHYEQAVRYRRELGVQDRATAELAATAVARLTQAADEALNREDLPAAGSYARRALDLVEAADPARDELLVLGCEALLSSGDVAAATPLVRELHDRSTDDRLAAWADCFRAQRWSLTDADRLTEAAALVEEAAELLGALDDQAGVAKARLVRSGCLARLGRVGECEAELDLALGAARAAGDRRRTVAVLGAVPLAALWGPSPVARAGSRCLDVLRLLRITTASPAVEATTVRCQGVLEALRGRFGSARDRLETCRQTARELGLRHSLYETELFAGFVELWAGDPIAAEPHLRDAQEGLGRLGVGADAGQAGALLALALLELGRVDDADAFAAAALDTAGQNLKTAIASRAALAEVRSVQGRHGEANALITEALDIAGRTDIVLDHALALLGAARIADASGEVVMAASHSRAASELLGHKGVVDDVGQPKGSDAAASGPPELIADAVPRPATATNVDDAGSRRSEGNRAWRFARASPNWGDEVDARRARLHPDSTATAHSRFNAGRVLDRDRYIEVNRRQREAAGSFSEVVRLLAWRADDLYVALVTRALDDAVVVYHVVVTYEDDQAIDVQLFDETQLLDALDQLDHQWVERGGPIGHTIAPARIRRAFAAQDERALRGCVTDDFMAFDHRPLGVGIRDADQWTESMRPMFASDGSTIPIWRQWLRADDLVGLYQLDLRAIDGSAWDIWIVQTIDGDRLAHTELFDDDQIDLAIARYEDLAAPARHIETSDRAAGLAEYARATALDVLPSD